MASSRTTRVGGGPPSADSAGAYVPPPFLVAAVGASAGGLEAISKMLSSIPVSAQLSIVLAQHLSRFHPSLLPDLLSRRTALRVTFGADGVPILVGHVYVIPPNKHITVIDGHLRVEPRPPGPWAEQVDALFESIAKYYRTRAVGVILSGALSDGSQGFRAIRSAGGVTIAQLPEEAQLGSMPRSAIATGDVDMILSAADIGAQLLRLSEQPRFAP